jgi:predicted dehydrogenase
VSATPASLRAAVVGAGLMGRWHAHAIRRVGGQVVAIIDSDLERAGALAARLPGRPVVTPDLARAIAEHGIDVVHVCAPLSAHEAIARQSIDGGAHLLLCPVHQFLFQRGILHAERTLVGLGSIRQIDIVACSAGADGRDDEEREQVALDILPHGLALARRLLAGSMTEAEWHVGQGPPGEIRATADVAGASVVLSVSMRARPTENSLTLRCDGGTVRANLFHGYATIERGTPSRLDKMGRPFVSSTRALTAAIGNLAARAVRREPAYPGLRELVRRFHLACAARGPSPISVEESLDVAQVRDRISEGRPRAAR